MFVYQLGEVANTPPFLKIGLSPSRCHEELSRIPRGLKILDHVGVALVVVAVEIKIEVVLNEIKEADVVDVVVVAVLDLILEVEGVDKVNLVEEGVEVVVVVDECDKDCDAPPSLKRSLSVVHIKLHAVR